MTPEENSEVQKDPVLTETIIITEKDHVIMITRIRESMEENEVDMKVPGGHLVCNTFRHSCSCFVFVRYIKLEMWRKTCYEYFLKLILESRLSCKASTHFNCQMKLSFFLKCLFCPCIFLFSLKNCLQQDLDPHY